MPKQYIARRIKKIGSKNKMQPIKNPKDLDRLFRYLLTCVDKAKTDIKKYQAERNYIFAFLAVNTAFRAEDLLQLTVSDIEKGNMSIKENKTGKHQIFGINEDVMKQVRNYIDKWKLTNHDYLFKGQKKFEDGISYFNPVTKQNMYEILTKAYKNVGITYDVGLHGLRKTFGYHYILNKGNILTLCKMYNHDSVSTTELYIMWNMDDVEKERSSFFLGIKKGLKK